VCVYVCVFINVGVYQCVYIKHIYIYIYIYDFRKNSLRTDHCIILFVIRKEVRLRLWFAGLKR
jgi:hypothetical protein